MTKRIRFAALAVAATTIPAVLSGCAASNGSSSSDDKVSVVGFSVLKTANEPVIADFQKTDAGKDVEFTTSYGASGDQSRAVVGGLHGRRGAPLPGARRANLVDAGLVDDAWNQTPTKGILTDSEVVVPGPQGQPPEHQDLGRPGQARRQDDHPQPRLVRLGEVEHPRRVAHVSGPAAPTPRPRPSSPRSSTTPSPCPGSGSDALASFVAGNGDVLLAYENDSIAAGRR